MAKQVSGVLARMPRSAVEARTSRGDQGATFKKTVAGLAHLFAVDTGHGMLTSGVAADRLLVV